MTSIILRHATAICLILLTHVSFAETFTPQTTYQTCFTPGHACTDLITGIINSAKESIYVQAYSFTSTAITKAIVNAKNRGVDVLVILDKSQIKNNRYSSSTYLMNNDVPVYIDYKPAIAHNKIMIIDSKTLITGSFNFTKAAQERNAENVLVINDPHIAEQYYANWKVRFKQSLSGKKYLDKLAAK